MPSLFTALLCSVLLVILTGCQRLPDHPDHSESQPFRYQSTAQSSASAPLITPVTQAMSTLQTAYASLQKQYPNQQPIYPIRSANDAFASRAALIRSAQHRIDLQYYIWNDDLVGRLLLLELKNAAARGVQVRLLLDDNSTSGLDGYLTALSRQPNFEIRLFNPFAHRTLRFIDYLTDFDRQQRRMHNKTLIADDAFLIVGGRNVGDSYFREDSKGTVFTDLDVLTAGAPVQQASLFFDKFWNSQYSYPVWQVIEPNGDDEYDAMQLLAKTPRLPQAQRYINSLKDTPFVQDALDQQLSWVWAKATFLSDSPNKLSQQLDLEHSVAAQLFTRLKNSTQQVDIVSAYFVPTAEDVATLTGLVKAGISVRVLTNSLASTDVPAVHAFYANHRHALLAGGVQLYEFRANDPLPTLSIGGSKGSTLTSDASLHAKIFGWDLQQFFVGSFNMDPRSDRYNTECGLLVYSPALATRLSDLMDRQMGLWAYQVIQNPAALDQLQWVEQVDGRPVYHDQEPNASWLDRIAMTIAGWLPIQQYM